jgi:hypothetical protein
MTSALWWYIELGDMKTTGLKSHTSIPASKRSKCADSNPSSKPNDFYQCTVQFKTCFESGGIISKQFTIGSSAGELSQHGKRRLARSEE